MRRPRRRIPRRGTWISLSVALLGWLCWSWLPLDAVRALASLTDPARLATLGERGANPRLNKAVYWLDDARTRGLAPVRSIKAAQWWNGSREPRASLVREGLLRNLKIAEELGLFAQDGRTRLRQGQAATITLGPYAGETAEIDHIVPYALAPEVGNELANLEMLPRSLNRSKSAQVGERQLAHARRLREAGLLTDASFDKVQARYSTPAKRRK